MKLLAVVALAACALVVSTVSSPAGAARSVVHRGIAFVPRHAAVTRAPLAPRKRAAAGVDCIASCADYESTINQYFTDVAADGVAKSATNVYSVLTQYSGILYSETFDPVANTYVDTNPFPQTKACHDNYDTYCVTDKQLETEIGSAIAANSWPTQSDSALYFIFTPANVGVCIKAGQPSDSNACTTNVFCAFHSSTNNFIYAVEPDAAAAKGDLCSTGASPAGNSADDTISTVSHEQSEAITDPFGDAWYVGSPSNPGPEIGDLCAYDFGSTPLGTAANGQPYNQVINSHDYYVQLEYSNQDGGCVPYLGGLVSPADPRDGTGPLVNTGLGHGGTVMATNTVYAIYWVPAAPLNSRLPKIAGAVKVGKKLKALSGGWTGAPDLSYRWLRCTATATACQGIAKATGSSYLLSKADAGHRIEVRVTATNAGGDATATSIPTAKVRT